MKVVEAITKWVYEGGCFIGIGEPSATDGYDTFFRLAQVLGVDKDNGARVCHGKWEYEVKAQQNHRSVSYTQLDVYKRQAVYRAERIRS